MIKCIALAFALLCSLPAVAQSQGDLFAKCLADSTTGKDRKDLARWIFVAMAAHPEIRDLASISPEVSDKSSREMGALVTRLLTENCAKEAQTVARGEGTQAMKKAFESLGRLAMLELTSNAEVAASVGGFERYLDKAKLTAVLEAK
jgi:hypothetical protein